ncbi:MAG: glycosyltransferase family 39 protein [Planctomycetota bacterium]
MRRPVPRSVDPPPPRESSWREWGFLVALALVAAGARFWNLGAWSVELDEALFLSDARHNVNPRYPLGYHVSAWVWDLFNREAPDEALLRLPSAVAGFLAVPATFWALSSVLSRRVAALSALLLGVSSWALFWSQMARFYTLAQLLGLVAGGFVLRGAKRASWSEMLLGLAVLALVPLAHPSGAFLIVGLWVAGGVLLFGRREPQEHHAPAMRIVFVIGSVIGFAFGLAWALDVLGVWMASTSGVSSQPFHLLLSTGYLVTPWVGLAFAVGLVRLARNPARESRALLALIAFAGLAALVTSAMGRSAAQYVFVLLPWMLGVAALALVNGGRRRIAAALVVLLSLADSADYHLRRHGDRPRWSEAAAYVRDHAAPGDLCLGMHAPALEYYLNPGASRLRVPQALTYLDRYRHDLPLRWSGRNRRVWLIVNNEEYEDWSPADREATREFLRLGCREVATFPVPFPLGIRDLDVTVLRWDP